MNTQRLLDLVKANEGSNGFDLGSWLSDCGTYGCLVGNHHVANPIDVPYALFDEGEIALKRISKLYKLTQFEAAFLFGIRDLSHTRWRYNHVSHHAGRTRDPYDKEAAINRVRKLIYYKLRKADLMSGGTKEYEEACKTGHINVAKEVKYEHATVA